MKAPDQDADTGGGRGGGERGKAPSAYIPLGKALVGGGLGEGRGLGLDSSDLARTSDDYLRSDGGATGPGLGWTAAWTAPAWTVARVRRLWRGKGGPRFGLSWLSGVLGPGKG